MYNTLYVHEHKNNVYYTFHFVFHVYIYLTFCKWAQRFQLKREAHTSKPIDKTHAKKFELHMSWTVLKCSFWKFKEFSRYHPQFSASISLQIIDSRAFSFHIFLSFELYICETRLQFSIFCLSLLNSVESMANRNP